MLMSRGLYEYQRYCLRHSMRSATLLGADESVHFGGVRCKAGGALAGGDRWVDTFTLYALQQSMLFHSVSERVAADAEHASRLDLIAFGRIKGLLNKLFF